jgi:hypothetical protein
MRKLIVLFLLFTGLIVVACSSNKPQISLEVTEIDLGDVINGEVIIRDVVVRNEGDAALVVDAVSTSCGCTQASLNSMSIEPGDSTNLHIEFDSGAHGPDLNGLLVRQIFINSNDPQQPEALIELAANVVAQSLP